MKYNVFGGTLNLTQLQLIFLAAENLVMCVLLLMFDSLHCRYSTMLTNNGLDLCKRQYSLFSLYFILCSLHTFVDWYFVSWQAVIVYPEIQGGTKKTRPNILMWNTFLCHHLEDLQTLEVIQFFWCIDSYICLAENFRYTRNRPPPTILLVTKLEWLTFLVHLV